jgi:BirA family biotin operon repressor/biotin-[acetyl-CoA-carboxylase] ligase
VIEGTCIERVLVFEDTLSTQDAAARACIGFETTHPPTLVVASIQRMGRGQRANNWYDAEGCTLPCSVAVGPEYFNHSNPNLAARAGLATLDAIRQHTPGHQISIKWPNDVLVRVSNIQRKIAGVLIERAANSIVIGIGINCTQDDSDFHPIIKDRAVSLAQLGVRSTRIELACSLAKSLDYWFVHASETDVRSAWDTYDALIATHIKAVYNNQPYAGEVKHIDPLEHIELQTESGCIRLPVTQTRIVG